MYAIATTTPLTLVVDNAAKPPYFADAIAAFTPDTGIIIDRDFHFTDEAVARPSISMPGLLETVVVIFQYRLDLENWHEVRVHFTAYGNQLDHAIATFRAAVCPTWEHYVEPMVPAVITTGDEPF